MITMRQRLGLDRTDDRRDDAGISLIEVVVAMMIFALISTGLLYSMVNVLSVNRDSRTRQVAANLAAEEVDRTRAVEDILKVVSWNSDSGAVDPQDAARPSGNVVLNGDVFTIRRTVSWVSDASSAASCGASSGGTTLRYKRVNVAVSWKGMRAGTAPVTSDTVVNPRAKINDPSKGTILVSVKNAASIGEPGVTVTSSPGLTIAPTDDDGCTYIFRVPPGTYTITVSKAGYVDNTNVASPTRTVIVTEGKVENRIFQYDRGIRYNFNYPNGGGFERPSNLRISAIDTNGVHLSDAPSNQLMHPTGSAYTFVAGDAEACPSANPANWQPTAGKQVVPAPSYSSAPGTPTTLVPIAMSGVEVSSLASDRFVRATSTAGSGHPACTTQSVLNFPTGKKKILLPYGTWKLESVKGTSVTTIGSILGGLFGGGSSGTITIDPRVAP